MTASGVSATSTHGFLFADLRDYSRFVETHGDDAAVELLQRYRRLVRDIIAKHDGAEIRTEGDSFYVVFPSASAAIRGAMAIVDAAKAEESAIAVGIGVHAGETSDTAEGPVGSAVNIAARVCAQAGSGEVLVTDTVRSLTRTRVEFRFLPRGTRELKGISEPIALFRVVHPEDAGDLALAAEPHAPAEPHQPGWSPSRLRQTRFAIGGVLVALAVIVFVFSRNVNQGPPSAVESPSREAESSPTAMPALDLLWQGSGPKQAQPGTYWPAIDPVTGDVWVASSFDNQFWIFGPNGRYLESWGKAGTGPGELDFATLDPHPDGVGAVAFAPDGSFFVANNGAKPRIEKFDRLRRFVMEWPVHGPPPGPKGIATDGKVVYVAIDSGTSGVMNEFDADGRPLRSFVNACVLFSLTPNGQLLCDYPTGVEEIDPASGKIVKSFALSATDLARGEPAQPVMDRAGHIFVTVASEIGVQDELLELDARGRVLARWAGGGETLVLSADALAVYAAKEDVWTFIRKYALPIGVPDYGGTPARTDVMPGPGPMGAARIAWSVALKGPAYMGPAVVDGVVYVAERTGDVEAHRETTGAALWTHNVGAAIYTSVAVGDGRVFVGDEAGNVTALDASTGRQVWQYHTAVGAKIRSSPVVVNGVVYLGTENNLVYALDANTDSPRGSVEWTYVASVGISHAIAFDQGILYLPTDNGALVALDASSGSVSWQVQLGAGMLATPAVADGVIYEATGLGNGQAAHQLYAIDAQTHATRWTYTAPSGATLYVGGVSDGLVLTDSGEDNGLRALDVDTGKERWSASTGGPNGGRAAIVDGTVYLPSGDGNVYAFNLSSGSRRWQVSVGGVANGVAVIDGRVLLATDSGRLVSIGGS